MGHANVGLKRTLLSSVPTSTVSKGTPPPVTSALPKLSELALVTRTGYSSSKVQRTSIRWGSSSKQLPRSTRASARIARASLRVGKNCYDGLQFHLHHKVHHEVRNNVHHHKVCHTRQSSGGQKTKQQGDIVKAYDDGLYWVQARHHHKLLKHIKDSARSLQIGATVTISHI